MASTAALPTWNLPYSRSDRWLLRFLPSLTDVALLIPIVLLWVLPLGPRRLLSDADTGWHIRTGEWILTHRAVPSHDLFSFTKSGQPWFAWEWAWDVGIALVHKAGGLGGVLLVNLFILSVCSALLYRLVRRACDHELIALLVTKLALCASMVHWLARPHLLSWVFFLLLLHLLARAEAGDDDVLRWTPLLFFVWVNVHGSFFLGIAMMVFAALGQASKGLLRAQPDLRCAWHWSAPFWFYSALSALVTLANPYGWREHAHILSYLGNSTLMDQIQEFQSPSFHGPTMAFYEVMLLAGLVAVAWCWRRKQVSAVIGIAFWAHYSLVSERNAPLFAFVAAPALAGMITAFCLRRERHALPGVRLVRLLSNGVRALRPFELVERWHLTTALVFTCVALAIAARHPGFEPDFSDNFPQSALPVVANLHPGRIFTSDQWGDFFLYHFYPRTKVFVDGRSDFYGPEFIDRCRNILNARWDWKADLDRFSVDMVVLPPDIPAATVLKSAPGWRTQFDNGTVLIFVRDAQHAAVAGAAQEAKTFGQPMRISAVVRNGRRELGAVSVCKYRTTT